MQVYEIQGSFGLENLKQAERQDTQPGPGLVRVKVHAASLNYRDLLTVQGMYNPKQPLPLIPCSDGAGEVVQVGEGVTSLQEGDRVYGTFAQGWPAGEPDLVKLGKTTLGGPLDGMLAEHVVLREEGLVKFPEHLTYEEAACLPCAGVTAWSALFRHGNLRAGDTVLILGTGGVSIFALQFAKLAGAEAIVTSSSDEKLERARHLGADHTINYKQTESWWKNVRELTGGRGVDYVVEVGGAGTIDQSVRATRMGGSVMIIGILSGAEQPFNLVRVLMQDMRLQGVIVGPRDAAEAMNRAIAQHEMRPIVDQVFPFQEAREAFQNMANATHFGKIAVKIAG